jgi:hypothetical protein
VAVDFYRNLPAGGYGLIILRVHSAIEKDGGPPVALSTSERYSQSNYAYQQLGDRLGTIECFLGVEGQLYFDITPNFVRSSMNSRFHSSIVIMMGCNGLTYTDMAEAFIEKIAEAYISWKGSIAASHADQATIRVVTYYRAI